jgi:hypothetical protein
MARKHDDEENNRQMAAAPYGTEQAQMHPAPLEAPVFLPGTLPIYLLKADPVAAPAAQVMQIANVDDPSSPPLRNNATSSAGAFMPVSDVVLPPAPTQRPAD